MPHRRHISLGKTLSGAESESIERKAEDRVFARVCLIYHSGKTVTGHETFGFAAGPGAAARRSAIGAIDRSVRIC
jgi:hypothetical protein